jgi:hypothetical protein
LDQSGYNRPETKDESASRDSKKTRPIEEKESWRRLETLERSTADIPEGIPVITVCGREGEELFAKAEKLEEAVLRRRKPKAFARVRDRSGNTADPPKAGRGIGTESPTPPKAGVRP